jgi:hypothetical protein
VLDQLLGAAVQESNMWVDSLHHLAVEFEHQAQHAMRRRVLRPEIDGEVTQLRFSHGSTEMRIANGEYRVVMETPFAISYSPYQEPLRFSVFSSPGSG